MIATLSYELHIGDNLIDVPNGGRPNAVFSTAAGVLLVLVTCDPTEKTTTQRVIVQPLAEPVALSVSRLVGYGPVGGVLCHVFWGGEV